MAGEIKVDTATAPATYGAAGADVAANRTTGLGLTTPGMRPAMAAPLTGMETSNNGTIDKMATVTGQGSQFAGGFDDATKDGTAKINAANNTKPDTETPARTAGKDPAPASASAGAAGGANKMISRLTGADLAKLVAAPYQSAMPAMQTAAAPMAQSVPQMLAPLASAAPQALQAPMQAVQAPVQSILSTPAGAQLLEQLLSRANASNGFDGGPASLPLASTTGGSGSSAGYGQKLHVLASRVLGIPYAWGGGSMTGPSQGIRDGGTADRFGDYRKIGFDCSGLARYITGQMYGVEIPRGSQAQYAAGMAVSHPVPGDLVFRNFQSDGPHHVQVYLGNGQVLEAPSSGQTVKVSPLSTDGSVFRRFVQIRTT